MKTCDECPGMDTKAVARTVTTFVLAVASMIVMALAGCANPRGIESQAALLAPTSIGAVEAPATAAIAADWWRGFDDSRDTSNCLPHDDQRVGCGCEPPPGTGADAGAAQQELAVAARRVR